MTAALQLSTDPVEERLRSQLGALSRWTTTILALSLRYILIGLVIYGAGLLPLPANLATPNSVATADSVPGLIGPRTELNGQSVDPSVDPSSEERWSTGIFRLGFSFFAAFCVGFALRRIIKLAALGCGLAFLFLFLLSYAELVAVDWQAIDVFVDGIVERLKGESGQFQTFVTGSLPVTGLASLGLLAGLRRR